MNLNILKNNISINQSIFYLFILTSIIFKSAASATFFLFGALSIYFYLIKVRNINNFNIKILFFIVVGIFINSLILTNIYGIKILDGDARYLLIPFIIINFINEKHNYKIIVLLLTICNTILLIQCLMGPYNLNFGPRWHTFMIDPNSLGVVAVISLFLIFFLNKFYENKYILIFNIILCGFISFKTEARAAIIAYSFILLLIPFKNKILLYTFYLLVALFFSRIGTLHEDAINIFNSINLVEGISSDAAVNQSNSSVFDRFIMIFYSWKVGLIYPFTGIGFENLGYRLSLNFPDINNKIYDILVCCGPHNEIFSSLFYKGFISFIFHLLVLFYTLKFALGKYRSFIIIYNLALLILSFGTEFTNLKYLQAFFLMWHCFLIAHLIKEKLILKSDN